MDRQHADLRSPRRLVRAGAFALVGVVAMLTSAVPASAHAGNGDTTAGHVCIDADGGYHLASEESSASCPTGQTAAHLASTPITGPQTTIPGDDEDGDSSTGSVGPAGPIGPRGPDGPTGPTGPSGAQGEPGLNGVDGLNGFDGADGAAGAAGPAGSQGEAGPQGAAGALGPAGANGADGADGEDGELGPSGPTGPQGPSGPAGSTGPQGTAGTAGASGSAGTTGATGSAGATGATGANGTDGADGRTILSGSDDPGSGDGDDGDYYINTDTNTIFGPKGAEDPGEWPDGVSLVGAAGSDGSTVLNGSGPPPAAATPGKPGDFYIDLLTFEIYGPKAGNDTTWPGPTPLVGDDGAAGASGANGLTVLNGNGAPPAAATPGEPGDFYIDVGAWTIYGPKAGNDTTWPGPFSLVGTNGANGLACWDLDGDGVFDDPAEDVVDDNVATAADCAGPQGTAGTPGSNAAVYSNSGSAGATFTSGAASTFAAPSTGVAAEVLNVPVTSGDTVVVTLVGNLWGNATQGCFMSFDATGSVTHTATGSSSTNAIGGRAGAAGVASTFASSGSFVLTASSTGTATFTGKYRTSGNVNCTWNVHTILVEVY
jgi:hypothetical protein